MKLLRLKENIALDQFLQNKHVINYGRTFLYAASEEIKAMLEREMKFIAVSNHIEILQIINPEQYTYVLLNTYNFDFSEYFEDADKKRESNA